jgi:hypothetical protein
MTSIIIMGLAVTVVVVLALVAAGPSKNGFTRKFITVPLTVQAFIEKNENVTGVAGSNKEYLFFGTNRPDKLFVTDHNLENGHMINTPFKYNDKVASNFSITIDSSRIELFAANMPAVFSGSLNTSKTDSFNMTGKIFTRAVKIDSGYYVFRGFDPENKMKDQLFMKAYPGRGIVATAINITPINNDAGISTDGMLHYDRVNKLLVYVSYYANQVYLVDKNLNVIRKVQTADTISSLPDFVGKKSEGGNRSVLTNIRPKKVINAGSVVSEGKLYVLSAIQSDKETPEDFNGNTVVDAFTMKLFIYEGSFYVPNYKEQKLWAFSIIGKTLVAIYRKNIIKYSLPNYY